MQAAYPDDSGRGFWCLYMIEISGLYVITDETIRPGRTHEQIARAAVDAGANVVQLRDKTATDRRFFEAAKYIREITRSANIPFIVNDRIDIALAVDADGINIGEYDLPVADARRILGAEKLIGASAGDLETARQAAIDGADHLGFGPIFDTATKEDAGASVGLTMLRTLKAANILPIVAIGGINETNIEAVAAAGADAAAVISAIIREDDMGRAVRSLAEAFAKGRA